MLVTAAGLAGGLGTIFLSLPPFYLGLWVQAEPAAVGVDLTAAVAALGLALAWLRRPGAVHGALRHPLALAAAALPAVSLAMMPSWRHPLLAWFGVPEHGAGVAWALAVAVFVAAALFVKRASRPLWRALLGLLAMVTLGLYAVTGAPGLLGTRPPYVFPDYVAFFAVAGAAAVVWAAPGRWRWPGYGVAGVVLVSGVWLSENRTAWGVLAFLAVLGGIVRFARGRGISRLLTPTALEADSRTLAKTAARRGRKWCGGGSGGDGMTPRYTAFLAPGAALAGAAALALVAVVAPPQPDTQKGSVASRILLLGEVVGPELQRDATALTGLGWGMFSEALLRNMRPDQGNLVSDDLPHMTERGTGWDAHRRVDFHAHNTTAERLLAGGPLLAVAYLALWWAAARRPARPRFPAVAVSTAFAALGAFWFSVVNLAAPMATALVAATVPRRAPPTPAGSRGRLIPAGLLLAALVLAVSGGVRAWTAAEATALMNQPPVGPGGATCATLFASPGFTQYHTAALLDRQRAILTDAPVDRDARRALENLLCAARATVAAGAATNRLLIGYNNAVGAVAFTLPGEAVSPRLDRHVARWGRTVDRLRARMPGRTDLLVPYLNHRLAEGDEAAVLTRARAILAESPTDPVGHWFAGTVRLRDRATAREGLDHLRRALDLGIRRVMPVDPATVERIRRTAQIR